jgi:hypothetical protein
MDGPSRVRTSSLEQVSGPLRENCIALGAIIPTQKQHPSELRPNYPVIGWWYENDRKILQVSSSSFVGLLLVGRVFF